VEETILADDSEKEGDDGPDANEEMYAHSEVGAPSLLPCSLTPDTRHVMRVQPQ
jgi:hypothetical protein